MHIDDLLRIAMERRASDLHLKVGNYPHLRVDGDLVPLSDQPRVTPEDMLNMAFSMMSNRQKQKFKENAELDMAYGVAGLGRFRVNVFFQRGSISAAFRLIPSEIKSLEQLGLPAPVSEFTRKPRGFVLEVQGLPGARVQAVGVSPAADSRLVVEVGPDQTREVRVLVTVPKEAIPAASTDITFTATDAAAGERSSARDHFIPN